MRGGFAKEGEYVPPLKNSFPVPPLENSFPIPPFWKTLSRFPPFENSFAPPLKTLSPSPPLGKGGQGGILKKKMPFSSGINFSHCRRALSRGCTSHILCVCLTLWFPRLSARSLCFRTPPNCPFGLLSVKLTDTKKLDSQSDL